MTKAQRKARERNFTKYRLEGVKGTLNSILKSDSINQTEKKSIEYAFDMITVLLDNWR